VESSKLPSNGDFGRHANPIPLRRQDWPKYGECRANGGEMDLETGQAGRRGIIPAWVEPECIYREILNDENHPQDGAHDRSVGFVNTTAEPDETKA
jgi:hypothetical protein